MPAVFPFNAVRYQNGRGDVSPLIAPPYDVLDAKAKARLLTGDHPNVVAIDLPHVPPKELGPAETYEAAGERYRQWLSKGVLSRRNTPAMFAYRQTFAFRGARHERLGMACTVEVQPFGPREGGGILPHEETFSGPKEDRFALMKAARAQFSPIFGLHPDENGEGAAFLKKLVAGRAPDMTGRMADDVLHEVWTVDDPGAVGTYQKALAGQDVFIADGHHRYTTQLNYLTHLESHGKVGPDHPARRCMIVLVSMSDPGLAIGPTHRVLGGMSGYSFEAFSTGAAEFLDLTPAPKDLARLEGAMETAASLKPGGNVLGFYDFATGACAVATPKSDDPLASRFADKPREWRTLDVALVQHLVVEQVCQPKLNKGESVKWAFPHSVEEVLEIGRGAETGAGGGKGFAQLAVLVRPTPLGAVRAVSRANQLMPQKSTFFYPKLATGLFMNPLE